MLRPSTSLVDLAGAVLPAMQSGSKQQRADDETSEGGSSSTSLVSAYTQGFRFRASADTDGDEDDDGDEEYVVYRSMTGPGGAAAEAEHKPQRKT